MLLFKNTLTLFCLTLAMPATAQQRDRADAANIEYTQQGSHQALRKMTQGTDVGNGKVGERQTREDTAPNIKPIGRIQGRIASRIQNRVRNRIDPDYDSQAGTISPFRVASEEAQRTRRR